MTGNDLWDFLNSLDPEQMDLDIMVHFQPTYPLQGILEHARLLGGKPVLAIGEGTQYGCRIAWSNTVEGDDEDDE
jgi:hypothetical protein